MDTPVLLSLAFAEEKRDTPSSANHKHVSSGYWVVLWKENDVIEIALEPWLNACPWHMWSLINFKWASGGKPQHNMTSGFVPMRSRVEKGPSRFYMTNHIVPLFRQ